MLVRTNLYPVARGAAGKSGKQPVTFIASYYGKKDSDGLHTETQAVDCWIPQNVASVLKANSVIDGLLNINGDFLSLKSFVLDGKTYTIGNNKEAEATDEEAPF